MWIFKNVVIDVANWKEQRFLNPNYYLVNDATSYLFLITGENSHCILIFLKALEITRKILVSKFSESTEAHKSSCYKWAFIKVIFAYFICIYFLVHKCIFKCIFHRFWKTYIYVFKWRISGKISKNCIFDKNFGKNLEFLVKSGFEKNVIFHIQVHNHKCFTLENFNMCKLPKEDF